MEGIWAGKVCFLIDKLDEWFSFSYLTFRYICILLFPLLGYHFSCPLSREKKTKYTNKPILFLNKWWLMGNVSHLCSFPLTIVAPTYFTAASLDDTPGEQMCSDEFTENSDVREMLFHYFPVSLLGAKSSAVQREVQSQGTTISKS